MREGGYITDWPRDIHNSREPLAPSRQISIDRAGLSAKAIVENL
jgi:hypothetical protein